MDFLKSQYTKCFVFFKDHLKRIVLFTAIAFIVLVAVSAIYLQDHPEEVAQLMSEFMNMAYANGVVNDAGSLSSSGLMTNNIKACLVSISLGVIPFIFLPVLVLLTNAVLIGAVIGLYNMMGLPMGTLAAGLLPHGIFELPALILALALGVYLCKELTMKIIGKRKGALMGDVFVKVVRMFICIVVPLMIIAGIIEAYITPLVMGI